MEKNYVYILISTSSNKYYIGCSNNPYRRLEEHNSNKEKSTKNRGSWKLCLVKEYQSLSQARKVESKLKQFKNKRIIERIVLDQDIKLTV